MKSTSKSNAQAMRIRQEFTTLPNLVTYARIALIPAVLWFITHDSPMNCLYAALVYTVASVTDALDGWLARRSNQVSMIGKFLDPLADKLIVTLVLIALVPLGRFPPWLLGLIVAREMAILGLRALAAGEGLIISASDMAKQKTALQLCGIVGLLLHYKYTLDFVFFTSDVNFHELGLILSYLSLALSLWSGFSYFRGFLRALQHRN